MPAKKLTAEQAAEIKRLVEKRKEMEHWIAYNCSTKALARRFDVHKRTIEKISGGVTWGEV